MARPPVPSVTTSGKNVEVIIALAGLGERVAFTPETLTATSAAKGATSVTVSATTNKMYAGQGLLFIDTTTNKQFFAQLTADAAVGATALTVGALGEAIPTGATAQFPPRAMLRTTADMSSSTDLVEVDTYDHRVKAQTPLTRDISFSLDGMYTPYCGALATLRFADANGREVWVRRTFPAPSAAYSLGESQSFFAVVESIDMAAPNDSFVDANVALKVVTDPVIVLPTPIA